MNYENEALLYAEKYGIIDYTVTGSTMTYFEEFWGEGTYKAEYDLKSRTESRKMVRKWKG